MDRRKSVARRMIAPCIVVAVVIAYYGAFGAVIFSTPAGPLFKLAAGLIPGGIMAAMLWVLWERYREIKGGYEDDIDNY